MSYIQIKKEQWNKIANPLTFLLTPRQQHDITQAEALLGESECDYVIANMSYLQQEVSFFRVTFQNSG